MRVLTNVRSGARAICLLGCDWFESSDHVCHILPCSCCGQTSPSMFIFVGVPYLFLSLLFQCSVDCLTIPCNRCYPDKGSSSHLSLTSSQYSNSWAMSFYFASKYLLVLSLTQASSSNNTE